MAAKVRDAGGVLRDLVLKVRDGGILRTIASGKVRDAGNVQRTFFTSGGGGGTSVWVDPPFTETSSTTTDYYAADFTAGYSGGTAPTSYAWGVVSGHGSVLSGGAAATARLKVRSPIANEPSVATFYCDVTIGGVVHRAECSMSHTHSSGGMLQ